MQKVFIVDCHQNPGLLRFTESKIFFDAKNQGVSWAKEVIVIPDISAARGPGIVINSGQCVTSNFRKKYKSEVNKLVDARMDECLISFTPDYDYDMRHRPPFEPRSKQLYILENLYKTVLRSKRLIYLENTESQIELEKTRFSHFYGLASGWKSIALVSQLGINNLETITIYDRCTRQLDLQRQLHQEPHLPLELSIDPPVYGTYKPPVHIQKFWPEWHRASISFEVIDLFSIPVFPENSLIWVSNVFHYEPNIFEHGWHICKSHQKSLQSANPSCTII
jgi:hypothetical protein